MAQNDAQAPEWIEKIGDKYAELLIEELIKSGILNEDNHESVLLTERIKVEHSGTTYETIPLYNKGKKKPKEEVVLPETEEAKSKADVFTKSLINEKYKIMQTNGPSQKLKKDTRISAGKHYFRLLILALNNSTVTELIRSDGELELAAEWYMKKLCTYISNIEELPLSDFRKECDYVFKLNSLPDLLEKFRAEVDKLKEKVHSRFPNPDTEENTQAKIEIIKTFGESE